ncbi:prephenate dehydrogenase/arogenate dehydrogenase family protein [Caproiciproducens sp. NJN-50]|uniref:prephenate dehydrogenase n=1 Tax=Acutalibacteraceae TaxID=3082771 RepID=UPI000FFE2DB3|nr:MULTISPECIES: prephenate dehydrogenase/arogenate dehydrogenase family protein [Acutalibacteraceae]QAT50860.1 prephenate dehydrogenase/arogenate dehydrogenase family protein [Caproiciproducens sp. NJN-50]
MNQNVVVAGLGLIGGSLAKAFRKYSDCTVTGIDSDPGVVAAALSCGAIRREAGLEDLESADLLFLCLYPQADIDFLLKHASSLRPGCVVTDVCGIKSFLSPRLSRIAAEHGLTYIGGHPMAGREKGGFANSDADLFLGASYLLVPCGAARDAVDTMTAVAVELGFGGTVVTTPEEHDREIAFTSQLPHALACAYVKSPQCPGHAGFSAGSYRDVSRVAAINEAMWAELFLDNREALTEELDTLIGNLREIRDAVDGHSEEALRSLLREGRLIKERLGEA